MGVRGRGGEKGGGRRQREGKEKAGRGGEGRGEGGGGKKKERRGGGRLGRVAEAFAVDGCMSSIPVGGYGKPTATRFFVSRDVFVFLFSFCVTSMSFRFPAWAFGPRELITGF